MMPLRVATINVHLMMAIHVVIRDAWNGEFVYILSIRGQADSTPKANH